MDITDEMEIGEYVNYTYDTIENYTYVDETNNISFNIEQTPNLEWKILNINEDNITLVSATTTQNPLQLISVYSASTSTILAEYNVLVDVLNNSCKKLYSNPKFSSDARSIEYSDYNDENKGILNNIENTFFYATTDNETEGMYKMWFGENESEPYSATVCYNNSYSNQTWGSMRNAYILPVVTINKSIFDKKENNVWQLKN